MLTREILILTIAITVTSCSGQPISKTVAGNGEVPRQTPSPTAETNPTPEFESPAPPEWAGIDFGNRSYPTTFRKRKIKLQNGEYEQAAPISGGDTFDLTDVNYVDINGDGRKEAIVWLDWISCGGSCDGGSSLIYFYSIDGTPHLLQRIETGSGSYECGLKSFALRARTLTLETFRSCRFDGVKFRASNGAVKSEAKFSAKEFTRFTFQLKQGRFALRDRAVFPNPSGENRRTPDISIDND